MFEFGMYILIYILCLAASTLFGLLSYWNGVAIINMTEYGGIFWKLRYNIFKTYANAKDIKKGKDILKSYHSTEDQTAFHYKRDQLNKLYIDILSYNPGFKLWLCEVCVSHRIALFYVPIYVFMIYWYGLFSFLPCLFLLIYGYSIASAIIYYLDRVSK